MSGYLLLTSSHNRLLSDKPLTQLSSHRISSCHLPNVERLDTERPNDIERPDVEWPGIEWPDAEWLDIDREWPDVERPDVERPDVENIEPRSPEPPESAELGMERHVQERRGNRAYCVYCLKHKEDWRTRFNTGRFLGCLEWISPIR
ncbi:hypothetical protein V8E54_001937 [Elaphomyces granulatus]